MQAFCLEAAGKTGKDEVVATGGAVPFSNDVPVLSLESRTPAAHDIFDVAAADADIPQLMIRELRQFAHRVSIPEPSVELIILRVIIATPFLTPRGVSKVSRHQKEAAHPI